MDNLKITDIYVERKHLYTFVCPKCHNAINTFELTKTCNVEVQTADKLDSYGQYNLDKFTLHCLGIIGNKSIKMYCPECKKIVMSFAIDGNIFPVIDLLNRKGFTTVYCCEGHINYYLSPSYIAFKDDVREKFDMNNDLLKMWKWDDNSKNKNKNINSTIRVNMEKISAMEFSNKTYINDLYEYITKYL